MHCTKCGTVLPDGAVFCSSCGAQVLATNVTGTKAISNDSSKKGNKFVGCVVVAVAVVILLGVIGSFAPKSGNTTQNAGGEGAGNTASSASDLPVAVSATELFQAYDNNEASAQGYFGDRPLLVSGVVDKVTLDFSDDPVVLLRTPNQFMSAQAALSDDAKADAGSISRGQKINMLCTDISEVAGTPMLKNCSVAAPDAKGQPVQWSDK